ncbi:MAG: hypothetical protein NT154_19435 [Verrucomicrobia bacterium]|nr:hypothetical protein [Verrucomicrobiota bacterium]
MLTCLQTYITREVRQLRAGIRGGDKQHLSIEETDEEGQAIIEPASADAGPDKQYDRAWAEAILENAKYRLEAELAPKGHLPLWEALQPNLYGEAEAKCYAQIGMQFGLTEAALCTAASRIRKRLRELLLQELRETVACQEDFDEERKHFREMFVHGPASAA